MEYSRDGLATPDEINAVKDYVNDVPIDELTENQRKLRQDIERYDLNRLADDVPEWFGFWVVEIDLNDGEVIEKEVYQP